MKKFYFPVLIVVVGCIIYFTKSAIKNSTKVAIHDTLNMPHKVTVDRIISLCKHPVPIIILGLDASERRLVGVNPAAKQSMQSNVLNKYFPGFQRLSGKVCNTAFSPNIEEIIKLKPDLVLNWSRFTEVIAQIQSFGLNVTGINYDGSDQNDRDMVNMIAKSIGREKMANSIMQWRDSTLKQIQSISNNIPSEKKPKVIFFYNYETLRVGGEKCYENFCINLVGGRNMGAGLGIDRNVNIEQVLEWDPDIILFGGWMANVNPDDIYKNPFFADLSAVRNRRVYKVPIWASNESVLIWKWMATMIQPALYHFDLRKDINASYSWQYKINLTESDIDNVLFYQSNAESALYSTLKSKN